MVALASAFVRLRPQPDRREFEKSGKDMGGAAGRAAGDAYGTGFKRGSDGKLRDAQGRFVKDGARVGNAAGLNAGGGFADGFKKGSGKLTGILKENAKLAAGVFVPLGIAGAVGEIAKIGITYENNLNIFKTVSKATGQQMDQVAAKARALGADVSLPGVSAAGAAAAMTELAKAGFTVEQSMDAAKGTLQLARIANLDEASAAEIAANAVNAFGIEAKDTSFVVDELAAAANSSSIEISDASLAFKQAASVYSGVQGPVVGSKEAITELNTAIAILGNNGIKGSDAGTSLRQTLQQLTGPSGQAKDAMKLLALNAGNASISQKQFNDVLSGGNGARKAALKDINALNPGLKLQGDIAYDASGKMRPLRDIIGLVAAGTQNLTQEQKNLAITTIFGADASRSILALLKGGVPVYDQQRKAILQQGAAAQFAAAKNAGLGGAIDNVKSQFENAAIAVYNAAKGPLTNSLNQLAAVLPKVFSGIAAFSKFVYDNIGVIRDWAVAIGAVTLALKINSTMIAINAAGGLLQWIKGISIITNITKGWAAAQALLNITLIANPIGIVIVALVALAAALVLLFRHNETFRKIVLSVWGAIKVAIGATVDWIVHVAWPAIVAAYNAIAAAAIWLWKNAIKPAWDGIMAAVRFGVQVVTNVINIAIAVFRAVASVVTWLYDHIFGPVFAAIKKAVEIWWLATNVIFQAFINVAKGAFTNAVNFFRTVFSAVFGFISKNVIGPWWAYLQAIFGAFRTYVLGPIQSALNAVRAFFARIFAAVAATVSSWWTAHVSPVLTAVKNAWNTLAIGFYTIYNQKIKPLFAAFIGFIRNTVVGGFSTAVAAIRAAWDKVKDAARVPVAFVVNHVINPFIGGLNKAAQIVGVKDRVEPIKGFASGGKISGAGGIGDNRQAVIPGVGAVQLQGGEFIVKRSMTAKALPLLQWINAGMKAGDVKKRLGRPVADMPGDGSEGFAFAGGGLIGWAKDVWSAVSNPVEAIKKPFESALSGVPGSGMIKDFLVGAAKKLLDGAVGWISRLGGSGKVGDAVKFLHAQDGKPYGWAQAGPSAYDCSGIVSAVYNIMHGKSPYSHTFSTESAGAFFPKPGQNGPMAAAWSHPGQAPASASVGHMMGRVGNLNFESTGSRGVHLGGSTRKLSDFANIGHYAGGGLFGKPIRLFDSGGYWPSGTLGANLSGHTEYVDASGSGRGIEFHAHFHAPVGDKRAAEDLVYDAWKSLKKDGKIK